MELTKYDQLKHGMKVKCTILGKKIEDAKLSVDGDGDVYICQNVKDGTDAQDKLGYDLSWHFCDKDEDMDDWDSDVSDLVSAEGLRGVCVGDILTNSEGEYVALDVRERVVLLSCDWDHDKAGDWYTYKELEDRDLSLKDGNEETILTLDEVAEKFGVKVEKLKIKK